MKGSPLIGGYLIMSNWKIWYQHFLDDQSKRVAEAFRRGLEGDYTPVTEDQPTKLSTWRDIKVASKTADKNFNLVFNDSLLNFNNDILNEAYLKCFKNASSFSFYSPQFLNKLFYFYLSDSNIRFEEVLTYCQDIPLSWFDTCPNCNEQNDDDWNRCAHCGKTFDESLDILS